MAGGIDNGGDNCEHFTCYVFALSCCHSRLLFELICVLLTPARAKICEKCITFCARCEMK